MTSNDLQIILMVAAFFSTLIVVADIIVRVTDRRYEKPKKKYRDRTL